MPATDESKFDMLKRLRIADYVTLANALCGVLSIFSSIQGYFVAAHILIFLGYEFDRFDGIVARWRNETSELGKQLDSLSDLVTFGLSPTVLVYSVGLNTTVDQAFLIFYVLSAVARLARFNVAAHLVPKDAHGKALFHVGLAIPYAALIISTSVAVSTWADSPSWGLNSTILFHGTWFEFHPAIMPLIAIGSAMISNRLKLRVDGAIGIPAISAVIFATCWILAPYPDRTVN